MSICCPSHCKKVAIIKRLLLVSASDHSQEVAGDVSEEEKARLVNDTAVSRQRLGLLRRSPCATSRSAEAGLRRKRSLGKSAGLIETGFGCTQSHLRWWNKGQESSQSCYPCFLENCKPVLTTHIGR